MEEKYGFVYIWFDKKHKRYYVGCHWGTETDGYICSSNWMRMAYARRPTDFKRRILKRTNIREELFKLEDHFLNLIKLEEMGKRYYNLQKHWRHWTEKEEKRLTVREKISIKTKEAMARPDIREKYLKGIDNRDLSKASSPEVIEQKRRTMMTNGKNKGKITVRYPDSAEHFHVTKDDLRWINGEVIPVGKGQKRTEEWRKATSERTKKDSHFHKINKMRVCCKHCGTEGTPPNIGRYHNDNCKLIV